MTRIIALRLVLVLVVCFVAAFLAARYHFSLRPQEAAQTANYWSRTGTTLDPAPVTSEGKVFYAVEGKERLVSEYDPATNTLTLVVMYDGAVRGELIRVKLNDRTVEGSRVAGWKVGGR
jgi:hypothetical protein